MLVLSHSKPCSISLPVRIFVRGKRTKDRSVSPEIQRAIQQLSVMSAKRKQPKMLKLSKEDYIKHTTIHACWAQYQRELREKRKIQLTQQYQSIEKAMDRLSELSPALYKSAANPKSGQTFPLELRVPTQYPPNTVWHYSFKKDS
ncbi:HHL062Wp [Eremothecium sinecaudum]|uniref:Large ribosomal subunit protein mL40 n=1 Tax=Eremothecium sinecaudum TaxID=45286 RepID=A0A109V0E2_9SACH|nr:HHL062Wp [Eremothecium sinecaudum]AMD22708.1 HHL062Wp [Eremothecium sinecaudum]